MDDVEVIQLGSSVDELMGDWEDDAVDVSELLADAFGPEIHALFGDEGMLNA